jgi:hypothetical protein
MLKVECNMEIYTCSFPKSSWASLRVFYLSIRFPFSIYTLKNNASFSMVIWNYFGAKPYFLHSTSCNNLLIITIYFAKKTMKCFRPSKTIQSSSLDLPKPLWSKCRSLHWLLCKDDVSIEWVLTICGYWLAFFICS